MKKEWLKPEFKNLGIENTEAVTLNVEYDKTYGWLWRCPICTFAVGRFNTKEEAIDDYYKSNHAAVHEIAQS